MPAQALLAGDHRHVGVLGRLPEADLGIEEARPGSYDVQLGLAMQGSRLVGFATTAARPDSPGPALTFLVELTRRQQP